jgi:hypothetical protein
MSAATRKPQRHPSVPCQPLTRVHYFTGRLLSAEDLAAEYVYLREKLRRHNRTLHQPGIVDGLEVALESHEVRVGPGLALDAAGNEICVPVAQRAALPSTPGEAYVVLRYKEIGINPIPVVGLAGEVSPDPAPSRIQESFEIVFERPGGTQCSTSPSDSAPSIRLARLRSVRGRWRLDVRFRRPWAK